MSTLGENEYRHFIKFNLLRIIGITNNNLISIDSSEKKTSDVLRQEENQVIFSAFGRDVASIEISYRLPDDSLAVGKSIINAFFGVSKFNISGSSKHKYLNDTIYEANIDLAIQKGICDWCAGGDNKQFHKLISTLEEWAVRTYEGKKVTFGFIFNPNKHSEFSGNGNDKWLNFLPDDYAATLSDCIHSVIELDCNCNFSQYLSITTGNTVSEYTLSHLLPYPFANVIQKYVTGDAVGIFLLNNGDIVLSKNQSIQFIKRNLKWLNLSYAAFKNVLATKFENSELYSDLWEQIYASILDVSFSHSGGIISAVKEIEMLTQPRSNSSHVPPILNLCDDLTHKMSLDEVSAEMDHIQEAAGKKKLPDEEKNKRLLKRAVIKTLINQQDFIDVDRKLRAELIAMDGACILDLTGRLCAVGAIIQNDSGSSGGGRSAAAKKLSNYGMAVKISTDGYIELFVNGKQVYSVE